MNGPRERQVLYMNYYKKSNVREWVHQAELATCKKDKGLIAKKEKALKKS